MSTLTPDQQSVVDAPIGPLCVIACAGSGKTKTAVHRLVQIRRNLGNARGRVALLSFSNVAVDTFRKAYDHLASSLPSSAGRSRVEIDTLDGFITTNIVRPHGHRTMGSARGTFLVTGEESFLKSFKFSTSSVPRPITSLRLKLVEGSEVFFHVYNDQAESVNPFIARSLITKLGKTGAYTHELGRYWAYRVLNERSELLAAIARRYSHILIDEAQDIGSVHQAILELLVGAGSCVTLIGDPHQSIYEFAGADGKFLADYHQRKGVKKHSLQRNFRSVPIIVDLANSLCGRSDVAARIAPKTPNGAFFTVYKANQYPQLISAFQVAMSAAGADCKRSVVLCRSKHLADSLRCEDTPAGEGLTRILAYATVLRDKRKEFLKAFKHVAVAVVGLLDNPPHGLVSQITQFPINPQDRKLRKEIWSFTRDVATGLPSSSLIASSQWHPLMMKRIKVLLARLEVSFGLKATKNIGRRLSRKALPLAPLVSTEIIGEGTATKIRIDTVHKAKGESLDAVLYVTTKKHAKEMLDGVGTEVGRIGYVAATRARDLLWVAVPQSSLNELRPTLLSRGFKELNVDLTLAPLEPKV